MEFVTANLYTNILLKKTDFRISDFFGGVKWETNFHVMVFLKDHNTKYYPILLLELGSHRLPWNIYIGTTACVVDVWADHREMNIYYDNGLLLFINLRASKPISQITKYNQVTKLFIPKNNKP